MKKIKKHLLSTIVSLLVLGSVGCASLSNTSGGSTKVDVTFVQEGIEKRVISVERGATLSELPSLIQPSDTTLVTEWNVADGFVVSEQMVIETTTYTKGLEFTDYTYQGKTIYAVSKYTGDAAKVIVPQYYKGGQVTQISEKVFQNNLRITEVSLPEGITDIGILAFYRAKNLKTYNIPSTLKYCRSSIFSDTICEGTLKIPDAVEEVGLRSFWATHFDTVYITGNTHTIKPFALGGSNLKTVVWGTNLTNVSELAFYFQPIEEIFYMGDENDWNSIVFEEYDYRKAPNGTADPNLNFTNKTMKAATIYYAADWEFVDGVPTPIK